MKESGHMYRLLELGACVIIGAFVMSIIFHACNHANRVAKAANNGSVTNGAAK